MQRRQFEAYLDKVFDLSARVAAMGEGRQDPAGVFALGCELARRLKRNGVLRSDWARGRIVAAVDGIEICSSFVRCCDACMERKVEHKVDGQRREDLQYYHRIVAVVLVSTEFPIPLDIRFQKNGETEVACAVAVLRELDEQLGRRFLDVLVGDALYLQQGFVKEVGALGLEWVFSLKENQPELLAEAQRLAGGPPETTQSTAQEELQLWHAPEVYWPVADRSVRVVKTVRIQSRNRVQVSPQGSGKKEKTKRPVREESTNYYATDLELGCLATGPQPLADRYRGVLNPHHAGASQASLGASHVRARRLDDDPRSRLHADLGLLSSSSGQPCSASRAHAQ